MPDITVVEFGLLGVLLILGLVSGWITRGNRCAREKIAVNAGWQEQITAQKSEHGRLAQQNKSLMEQISENQASHKDSKMRAQELSDLLKEAFERRDELQRKVKEVRSNLELALTQRDELKANAGGHSDTTAGISNSIKEKDDKIFYLSRELQSWQDRVPPLVARFRERDLEAQQVEAELEKALQRIDELESQLDPGQTRVESVDRDAIANDLSASNDQYEETAEHAIAEPQDQSEQASDDEQDAPGETIESLDATEQETDVEDDLEATGSQPSDNLRLIKGVGPAIEKTLNDLGIFRFIQIAEMSEFDIDRVAQQLRGFRGRIYREDWVGQARALEHQKNNDPA